MWGAIIGDIVGSRFEFNSVNNRSNIELFKEYCCYTDDTVMTVAVADTLLKVEPTDEKIFKENLIKAFHRYGETYISCGFGARFFSWILNCETKPYNSLGNGSAMRVSPAGWYAKSLEEAELIAKLTAEITHDHPEGIKGAQSVAGAILLARQGKSKDKIKDYVTTKYGYNLDFSLVDLKDEKHFFDMSCQTTVPIAFKCFLDGEDFTDTVRKAILIGGDTDTIAAIAGSIAEAYFGIDNLLIEQAKKYLDKPLLNVAEKFTAKYVG